MNKIKLKVAKQNQVLFMHIIFGFKIILLFMKEIIKEFKMFLLTLEEFQELFQLLQVLLIGLYISFVY